MFETVTRLAVDGALLFASKGRINPGEFIARGCRDVCKVGLRSKQPQPDLPSQHGNHIAHA